MISVLALVSALAWQDAALADIRSEKQVIEARFTDAPALWVSVEDDGSIRDGYAEHLCTLIRAKLPEGVRIVVRVKDDIDTFGRNLGKTICFR